MAEVARSDLPTPPSPWRPLGNRTFRNLLAANLILDFGAFMQSVGAAWLMTPLTDSPLYIALIQTATALPFFSCWRFRQARSETSLIAAN